MVGENSPNRTHPGNWPRCRMTDLGSAVAVQARWSVLEGAGQAHRRTSRHRSRIELQLRAATSLVRCCVSQT